MAFEKRKRRTVYNLVHGALEGKPYFKKVHRQLPVSPPAAGDDPQAFLALLPETNEGITNKESEANFRIAVILFVRGEQDIDLVKLEAQDEAEQAINNLQTDTDFQAVASLIQIERTDPGPLALNVFGLNWVILPPFGVLRMDVRVSIIYEAFD